MKKNGKRSEKRPENTKKKNYITLEMQNEASEVRSSQMTPHHKWCLDIFNAVLTGYFFVTTVTLAAITPTTEQRYSMPLYSNFAAARPMAPSYKDWEQHSHVVTHFAISYLSLIYNGTGFFKHFLSCTWVRTFLHIQIEDGHNRARAIEYFFSYGIMHVQVAWICGVLDLHMLCAIFGIVSAVIILGYFAQWHNSSKKRSAEGGHAESLCLGAYLYSIQWTIVTSYLFYSYQHTEAAPPFVVIAWAFLTALDGITCVVIYGQLHKIGFFRDAFACEACYLVLGFLNKACITWIVYGGIQQLS